MSEKCANGHCTKVITAECDIQHLQDDIDDIKGTQLRIIDKTDDNLKWLIGLAIGVGIEFVGMVLVIFLNIKGG